MAFRDRIPGGRADRFWPSSFDPAQLRRGIAVEMEHTSDPQLAREIAMDHLVEDPIYYTKLATVHLDGTRKSTGGKSPQLMGLATSSFGRIARPRARPMALHGLGALLPKKTGKGAREVSLLRGPQVSLLGETAMLEWLKTQNPLVMGVTVLGMSLVTGLVVSSAAVWTLNKLR